MMLSSVVLETTVVATAGAAGAFAMLTAVVAGRQQLLPLPLL